MILLKIFLLVLLGMAILALCDIIWEWYDGWWNDWSGGGMG